MKYAQGSHGCIILALNMLSHLEYKFNPRYALTKTWGLTLAI